MYAPGAILQLIAKHPIDQRIKKTRIAVAAASNKYRSIPVGATRTVGPYHVTLFNTIFGSDGIGSLNLQFNVPLGKYVPDAVKYTILHLADNKVEISDEQLLDTINNSGSLSDLVWTDESGSHPELLLSNLNWRCWDHETLMVVIDSRKVNLDENGSVPSCQITSYIEKYLNNSEREDFLNGTSTIDFSLARHPNAREQLLTTLEKMVLVNELSSKQISDDVVEYHFDSFSSPLPETMYFRIVLPVQPSETNFSIEYFVNGDQLLAFDYIWLKTRHEELYSDQDISQNGGYNLPIPPVWPSSKGVIRCTYEKKAGLRPAVSLAVYGVLGTLESNTLGAISPPLTEAALKGFVELNCDSLSYDPAQPEGHLAIQQKSVLCKWWIVICYKGQPCLRSITNNLPPDQHVLTELTVSVNQLLLKIGDANYYSEVLPTLFGCDPAKKYMVYQCIFHDTPPLLPYAESYHDTDLGNYLTSGSSCYSTLNISEPLITDVCLKWNKEFIESHFSEPDQVQARFYSETYNALSHQQGVISHM